MLELQWDLRCKACLFCFLPGYPVLGGLIVFALIVVVSYGFELFSKVSGLGHYDVMDAVASIIGGVLGMGLFLLIQILF